MKILAKGVAAILGAGVIAAGVCCAGFASRGADGKWFKNGNLSTWHWSDKTADNNGGNTGNGTGGGVLNVIESNGIMLTAEQIPEESFAAYDLSEDTENAYLLTATVEPENAADKRLLWGTSWKDSASDWAQGKRTTDFVNVRTLEEYSNKATLTCTAAFGEPIELTICGLIDRDVNCTVQLDYLKHIESYDVVVNDNPDSTNLFISTNDNPQPNTLKVIPHYGVGTVEGTITNIKTEMTLSDNMVTELNKQLKAGLGTSSYFCSPAITFDGKIMPINLLGSGAGASNRNPIGICNGGGNSTAGNTIVNNFLYQYAMLSSNPQDAGSGYCTLDSIKFTVTYSYGDTYSTTIEKDGGKARFVKDGLSKISTISSITPDKDNVIFY